MKRKLAAILVLVMLLLCAASCTGPAPVTPTDASGNPVTTAAPLPQVQGPTDSLTISGGPYTDNLLAPAITIFKQQYPNVTVNYTPFDDSSVATNYAQYQQTIQTELQAGTGPDVLVFNDESPFQDLYKTMDTGAFCDLNGYIANDPGFDMSQYNQTVMNAGVYDGKRYMIPLDYYVPIWMSSQENLTNAGFDFSDLSTFDGMTGAIQKYYSDNASPEYLLFNGGDFTAPGFLSTFGVPVIDRAKKTVDVDSAAFKTIMDMEKAAYNSQTAQYNADYIDMGNGFYTTKVGVGNGDGAESILNRKNLFFMGEYSLFSTFCQEYGGVLHSETPVLFAVPNPSGGSTAQLDMMSMVPAASNNQSNAYAFIKILLSDLIQNDTTIYSLGGAPVLTSAIDNRLTAALGKFMPPKTTSMTLADGITTLVIDPMQQKTIADIEAMLSNVTFCQIDTTSMYTFFQTDMTPYFTGVSDYATCLAKLKNDLELYVSE